MEHSPLQTDLQNIRSDYSQRQLRTSSVHQNPLTQIEQWVQEAIEANALEPTAMTLATVAPNCTPTARVVLLKGIDTGLLFYTNYESTKGKNLANNPNVAAVLFWPELERQLRVQGTVEKLTNEESFTYFQSRPLRSKRSAWASKQSQRVQSREFLEEEFVRMETQFPTDEIPLPPTWGGYRIVPTLIECWQGRRNRLHDRIEYTLHDGAWKIHRLAP
jgi:pyridoxamine 5'-phosphate oxidase